VRSPKTTCSFSGRSGSAGAAGVRRSAITLDQLRAAQQRFTKFGMQFTRPCITRTAPPTAVGQPGRDEDIALIAGFYEIWEAGIPIASYDFIRPTLHHEYGPAPRLHGREFDLADFAKSKRRVHSTASIRRRNVGNYIYFMKAVLRWRKSGVNWPASRRSPVSRMNGVAKLSAL